MSPYPDGHEWVVQMKLAGGEWGTSLVTDDRDEAYDRLHKRKEKHPGQECRIVKATTAYTLDPAEPRTPEFEHANANSPADTESDNT